MRMMGKGRAVSVLLLVSLFIVVCFFKFNKIIRRPRAFLPLDVCTGDTAHAHLAAPALRVRHHAPSELAAHF